MATDRLAYPGGGPLVLKPEYIAVLQVIVTARASQFDGNYR